MPLTDQIKNLDRKLVEAKPVGAVLARLVHKPKPLVRAFVDDGIAPNHPRFPFVLHRGAVRVHGAKLNAATIIDTLFSQNGWRSWRDSVDDFVHYHSRIHEVMGVARGLRQGPPVGTAVEGVATIGPCTCGPGRKRTPFA
jgi:hypothetical protein